MTTTKLFAVATITLSVLSFCSFTNAATLVARYAFENAGSLGDDSSGMGNHASTVTNVAAVAGWQGGGAFFDESLPSTFAKNGGLTGYNQLSGMSMAAWVKMSPAAGGFNGIISQDTGGCCLTRILFTSGHTPYLNVSQHSDRNMGGTGIPLDDWAHIALTAEPNGLARFYINGVEHESSPQQFNALPDASTWNTYLGAGEAGSAHRMTGALDDVRVYEGVLTQQEVLSLMVVIPEPSSLTLAALGLLALLGFTRRRK